MNIEFLHPNLKQKPKEPHRVIVKKSRINSLNKHLTKLHNQYTNTCIKIEKVKRLEIDGIKGFIDSYTADAKRLHKQMIALDKEIKLLQKQLDNQLTNKPINNKL